MGKGSVRILVGAAFGASFAGGFATGVFCATPAARSAGQSALGGIGTSARYLGSGTVRAAKVFARTAESGYTRVRGREAYLERQIDALREQISDLEERVPSHEGSPERNGSG